MVWPSVFFLFVLFSLFLLVCLLQAVRGCSVYTMVFESQMFVYHCLCGAFDSRSRVLFTTDPLKILSTMSTTDVAA